jgi:membrane protein DedA with SNARE-associated domain
MSVGHILALIVFLGVLLSFVVPLPEVAIRLFIGMLAAARDCFPERWGLRWRKRVSIHLTR